MQPYIVEEMCDEDGECIPTTPTAIRQVIDPDVSWTLRRMLVNSANHYAPVVWASQTANWGDQWLVPGYQVCAKTGTSSIPLPGGGYDNSATIGSVLGFAPADNARYAVLVKVDRPADIWGVATAIPLFQTVVSQILQYERLPPDPGLVSPGQ
jgi:cell division protein FtsI (penicillin-binding protein 3)